MPLPLRGIIGRIDDQGPASESSLTITGFQPVFFGFSLGISFRGGKHRIFSDLFGSQCPATS
jgi:hypothetical protein